MRVAYVVSRFPVASETFVLREMNALRDEHGIDVTLLALFPPEHRFVHPDAARWLAEVRRTGVLRGVLALAHWWTLRPRATTRILTEVLRDYHRSPPRLVRALVTVAIASAHARAIQREGIGHVHAHFATYPALTAWVCERLTGATYSVTAHAHDIFVDQSHLRTMVTEAAFLVTISDFNRGVLREWGGDAETPVHVVHCGVDPARYAFVPRAPGPEGPVRALCVASLEEYKGHDVLLRALTLDARLSRVELDLVGGGSLLRPLQVRARELGVADRVRFLGSKDEGEVARLLGASDLFVLPSIVAADGQMEGVPVALMEALASGVPTVSTALSGIPELVRDGVTGLLAAPGDAEDLARVLVEAVTDPEAALRRAAAGRAHVEREYDVRRSAAVMAQLFAGVAD